MMDLRGQQQEKRLGMPNSLGGFGDPPTKISSINTTGNGIAILTSPRHAATTVDHHHHHHQQQQPQQQLHYHHHHQQQQHQPHQQLKNRQDEERSPEPPALPPPQHHHHHHQTQQVIDTHTDRDRDPDPVSIAVVSAAIQPISTTGSNPRTPRSSKIRYRECLKNHAASIGGHVVDGCGEFMPGGEEGSVDALKCAACDCHRNFHRKELDGDQHHHHHLLHHHSHQHGGVSGGGNCFYCYNSNNKTIHDNNRRNARIPAHSVQPIQHQSQQQKFTLGLPSSGSPPVMMAFGGGSGGGGAATDSSSEDLNNTVFHSNAGSAGPGMMTPLGGMQFSLSKKRFRTKFTQEQKDRMLEFAEKVGWRIQKQDEIAVQQFCAEVGVKRQVLKVWMHNNKHAMKKKVDM